MVCQLGAGLDSAYISSLFKFNIGTVHFFFMASLFYKLITSGAYCSFICFAKKKFDVRWFWHL